MPSPEKFRKTLDEYCVPQEVIERMYEGFEKLDDKADKSVKSLFFKKALEVMKKELPEERVQEIFESNACCKSGVRAKNSREEAKQNVSLGIEEKLQRISERPEMNMGRAELDSAGFLIVHGVSFYLDGKFQCACPTLGSAKRDYEIPREYCYCCGGHFKYHYEIMLGRKLRLVEIVSSPHLDNGKSPCVFKYEIVEEDK